MLEQLEELLISSDMGVDTALRVSREHGRRDAWGANFLPMRSKTLLAAEIARIMEPVAKPLPIYSEKTSGRFGGWRQRVRKDHHHRQTRQPVQRRRASHVVIAAGDTFRAAAVEQLQVWGQPALACRFSPHPKALILPASRFDAMAQAEADGADLLMIDTAGRLQNRADLMEELSKIVRVIQ